MGAFLGKLEDGTPVFDRGGKTHIQPRVRPLLSEALRRTRSYPDHAVVTVDFGRVIGFSTCVETRLSDPVVYAIREHRAGHSRLAPNLPPINTSLTTLVLLRKGESCILISAWIGPKAEPEPWDTKAFYHESDPKEAFQRSLAFWHNHALIGRYFQINHGSEVRRCPWPTALPPLAPAE